MRRSTVPTFRPIRLSRERRVPTCKRNIIQVNHAVRLRFTVKEYRNFYRTFPRRVTFTGNEGQSESPDLHGARKRPSLGLQVPPQKVFGPSKPTPNTFSEGTWSPRAYELELLSLRFCSSLTLRTSLGRAKRTDLGWHCPICRNPLSIKRAWDRPGIV